MPCFCRRRDDCLAMCVCFCVAVCAKNYARVSPSGWLLATAITTVSSPEWGTLPGALGQCNHLVGVKAAVWPAVPHRQHPLADAKGKGVGQAGCGIRGREARTQNGVRHT